MFKRSQAGGQLDMFESIHQLVGSSKSAQLEDESGWHNLFFKHVTSTIDETIFRPLFSERMGRSNAPIRILLSMMILKEGNNWTDEQLFEEACFNLKVLLALGLTKLADTVPSPSTYYNFRNRIISYDIEHGTDLLGDFFISHAQGIAKAFGIKGNKVRMDSKLFSSNIAKSTRLQLIVKSLRNWLAQKDSQLEQLSKFSQGVLEKVAKQHAERFTFRMNKKDEKDWLEKCGIVIKEIVDNTGGDTTLLERILSEQYTLKSTSANEQEEDKVELKDPRLIDGSAVQSPHDPEASYRRKENGKIVQTIRGYVSNITETCSEDNEFNIITSVQTQTATYSDDKFFIEAIETTKQVLANQQINEVVTDGAYHNPANVAYAKGKKGGAPFTFYTQAVQGNSGNFDYEWVNKDQLKVTDRRTGLSYLAKKMATGKYRIKLPKGYQYIFPKALENYFIRKRIEENKVYITNMRANVEGTIHQVFHTLNGKKSKYRGLKKNHFYAILRSLWSNFKRLAKSIAKKVENITFFAFFAIQWFITSHRIWWQNLPNPKIIFNFKPNEIWWQKYA